MVYIIESPYQGDVARNKVYLQQCIRDCLRRGESPYASHQMLTDALDDRDPKDRALAIEAGLHWRRKADHRAFYVDYGWSQGMRDAQALYRQEGLAFSIRVLGVGVGMRT